MSACIKDLFDHDSVKECSKCGIITMKKNFHKKDTAKNKGYSLNV